MCIRDSVYAAASLMHLPERFLAGLSLASGWPGLLLILVVVPPLVRGARRRAGSGEVG